MIAIGLECVGCAESLSGGDAAYRFNNCPMGAANCGHPPVDPGGPVDPPPVAPPPPPGGKPGEPPGIPAAGDLPALPARLGLFGPDPQGGMPGPQDGTGREAEGAPRIWAAWPASWPLPALAEPEE